MLYRKIVRENRNMYKQYKRKGMHDIACMYVWSEPSVKLAKELPKRLYVSV